MDNNTQVPLFNDEQIPVTKNLKALRNDAIRADYLRMTGKEHLDRTHVLEKLRLKYFLEVDTLWMIIFGQGYYKK
jgi:hypothetical protein